MSLSTQALRSVLFDLDGTLLDTAPDLAAALNHVLVNNARAALPFETIRPWVSHGGIALIKRGFGIESDAPGFDELRRQLLDFYRANLAIDTSLFHGMEAVLDKLETAGIKWGVVTNKPGWLTEPLLEQLGLTPRSACIVSGDTLSDRKPHPAPLEHACRVMGCNTSECVYIGDAERDIVAGKNAGMPTLVALFGYVGEEDQPHTWGADAMLDTPSDILSWISDNYPGTRFHGR